MADQEPYSLCPYCRERIDPDAPGVVYAIEQREVLTFGPTRTIIDGLGGFFHAGCPPEALGYVLRPGPQRAA